MIDPEDARSTVLRELREIIPPELVRVLAETDFTARYEKVCTAHPPRLQAVTGPQRRDAAVVLGALGRVDKSPGGNHRITVEGHPEGVHFDVTWRPDSRVEAFLIFTEGGSRCGSNFAVLAHASRSAPVSPGQPSHPRPHAATGEELRAVAGELLVLGLEAGRRFVTRPGSDLRWRAPAARATRLQDASLGLAQRTARLVRPPSPPAAEADLSVLGVARAVRRSTTRVVLVVLAIFGLIGVLPMLLLSGSLAFIVVAGVLTMLLTGSIELGWRRKKVASDYVQRVHLDLSARATGTTAALRQILADLNFQPGLEQLTGLEHQYAAFEAMLGRKLDPTELTYSRYLATAEQVFLAGLDNLTNIVDILDGLSAIDVGYISRRIRHLETDGIESAAQDAEIRTLKERLELLEAQHARISELLSANEAAMTRLAHAGAALSAMDTTAPHAQVGMEAAMRELQELTARAPAYSRDKS